LGAVAHIRKYKQGYFYSDQFRGTMSWNGYEHNVLFRNDGTDADGRLQFTNVATALGADEDREARGVAVADFDNDGDLDIVINNNPGDSGDVSRGHAILLRNEIGERRSWIAVELIGTKSNREGVGALVTVEAGGKRQVGLASAGSGYASENGLRLYFGLGSAEQVDHVEVRWPSGHVDRFGVEPARRLLRITEGGGVEVSSLPALKRNG